MTLSFKRPEYRLEFEGGEMTVRGLSTPEITMLVNAHRDTAERLFGRVTGKHPDTITIEDASSVATAFLAEAPGVVAHIVSVGADATDQFDLVVTLPPDVLVAALQKIATMTFAMAGGPKNFVEMVLQIATGTNHLVSDLRKVRT